MPVPVPRGAVTQHLARCDERGHERSGEPRHRDAAPLSVDIHQEFETDERVVEHLAVSETRFGEELAHRHHRAALTRLRETAGTYAPPEAPMQPRDPFAVTQRGSATHAAR